MVNWGVVLVLILMLIIWLWLIVFDMGVMNIFIY